MLWELIQYFEIKMCHDKEVLEYILDSVYSK